MKLLKVVLDSLHAPADTAPIRSRVLDLVAVPARMTGDKPTIILRDPLSGQQDEIDAEVLYRAVNAAWEMVRQL